MAQDGRSRGRLTGTQCTLSGQMDSPVQHWYQPIADFLGPAYLRNAFTKGTVAEVDFLMERLGLAEMLQSGAQPLVLDAGCGPGRHSLELARRGCRVEGVDIAPRFVELASEAATGDGLDCTFRVGDLAQLEDESRYDAVICLCQGGFGLPGGRSVDVAADQDQEILRRLMRALRPGRRLALGAFNAFFAVSGLWEGDHVFDVDTETFHEVVELRGPGGETRRVPAVTNCYTPRELRLVARAQGLRVLGLYGVRPGDYGERPPRADAPELLLIGERAR